MARTMPEESTSPPKVAPPVAADRPVRSGRFRFSAAQFLISLVFVFIAFPFVEFFQNGDTIEAWLMTLVLVSGVLAVARRRRTLVLALVLV